MNIPKPYMPLFQPPVYLCKKTTETLVLDGNLDKEFWRNAPFSDPFIDIEGSREFSVEEGGLPSAHADKEKPKFNTQVKMLWDNDNLYIGAVLEGDEIWATQTQRDSIIFNDNDFEVFLSPSCDTHTYYEFEMNALNTVWDLLLTKSYLNQGYPVNAFDIAGLQTAVHIDGTLNDPSAKNRKWSLEIVMPFATLTQCRHPKQERPASGDYWRMNFSRVQWDVDISDNQYVKQINPATKQPYPEHNWVYAPTGIVNIHYPELWGFLFFTEGDETYTIPEAEKISWELRKVYYNMHEYYEKHGTYTTAFPLVSAGYEYEIPPLIEITKHSFELSLSIDKNQEIYMFADGFTKIENK